jgi:hypothetical protein
MKRPSRWAIWFVGVLFAAGTIGVLAQDGEPAAKPAAKEPAKPRPRVTISRETTFITGPLREDGYPDYVGALNELASRGVTPENNAAVLFCRAFGPLAVLEKNRDRFFRMLGIPLLPPEGKYLVSLRDYVDRNKGSRVMPQSDQPTEQDQAWWTAEGQRQEAMTRPWAKEEFPVLAKWLEANEESLNLVLAGTRRSRCYVPIVSEGTPLWGGVWMAPLEPLRESGLALGARAMLRLKEGRVEEAHHDLLACHRLARLAGQGPMLAKLADPIERVACRGHVALAHYGNLSGEHARTFADEVRKLPPMAGVAEKVNVGARYTYLDAVCSFARLSARELGMLIALGGERQPMPEWLERTSEWLVGFGANIVIDWDEPLRMGNAWFDRLQGAYSKASRREREAALSKMDRDVAGLSHQARDPKAVQKVLTAKDPQAMAGQFILALMASAHCFAAHSEDRTLAYQNMALVAFALAAYRTERGEYPAELGQLVPKYLKAVPGDTFSGKPLRYKREGAGYLLYSIPSYGEEDGSESRFIEDPVNAQYSQYTGADIVIRMPVPKKRAE